MYQAEYGHTQKTPKTTISSSIQMAVSMLNSVVKIFLREQNSDYMM
jgi:hypothetical protein